MKIRNGFVSNSSSSSFIVAATPKKATIKFTIEVDLEKYAQDVLKTEKDVIRYFHDRYRSEIEDEEDYVINQYTKALDAVKQGKHILCGSFSSDGGEALEMFLCDNGIKVEDGNTDVEVIYNEAGY